MTPETPLRQNVRAYHEKLDEAIEARKASGGWNPTTAASGLRIGLLKEAWAAPQLSEEVAAVVKQAAQRFAALGGTVEEVSIPMHDLGAAIFTAVVGSDMPDVSLHNKPPDCLSWPIADLMPPTPDGKWFETMNKSAPMVVNKLFRGEFLKRNKDTFPPAARGKAVTHVHELRAAYDATLAQFDVLITPCNPTVGMKHLTPDMSVAEKVCTRAGQYVEHLSFQPHRPSRLVYPRGLGQDRRRAREATDWDANGRPQVG